MLLGLDSLSIFSTIVFFFLTGGVPWSIEVV